MIKDKELQEFLKASKNQDDQKQKLIDQKKNSLDPTKQQMQTSKTGCPTGDCDRKRRPSCIHKGGKAAGGGDSEESKSQDDSIKLLSDNDAAKKTPKNLPKLLFATPQDQEEVESELDNNTQFIPSLVPISVIKNELEEFIKEQAKQLGIETEGVDIVELGKQLGITYQDNGNSLSIRMSDEKYGYRFLDRFDSVHRKHMIQIPQALQAKRDAYKAQIPQDQQPIQSPQQQPQQSQQPFNPQPYFVRTTFKPEGFDR